MVAAEVARETLPFDGDLTSRGSLREPQPPFSAQPPKARKRRGWAPDDTDHKVYQWVKFDGKRQHEIASLIGIDQSTVSRIVTRYEKWQAHATPATDGRLSHEERRRAQRWLTYERNERIVASAQRLADEMARSIDASKTVITRANLSDERQTRTELFVMDRTQMAARFLRLAQKVSMDNLKLVELEPLAELPPLDEEEVAEQVAEATESTRAVEAAKEAAEQWSDANQLMRERIDADVALAVAAEVAKRMKAWEEARMGVVGRADEVAGDGAVDSVAVVGAADGVVEVGAVNEVAGDGAAAPGDGCPTDRGSPRDPQPPTQAQLSSDPVIRQSNEPAVIEVQVHNLHKMHNCITPKSVASADAAESCERNSQPEISDGDACITAARSRGSLRDPQPPIRAESMTDVEPSEAGASGSFRPGQEPGTESPSLVIRPSDEPAVVELQVHNLHKMHNCITPKSVASADADESCERKTPDENSDGDACITAARSRGSLHDPQPPNPL